MRRVVDDSLATDRFAAFLLAAFALIAVLLAASACSVCSPATPPLAARDRDPAGACSSTGGILGLFLRRAALYATVGIVIGSVIAVSVAGGLSSLLFGVSPRTRPRSRSRRSPRCCWLGWRRRCQPGGQSADRRWTPCARAEWCRLTISRGAYGNRRWSSRDHSLRSAVLGSTFKALRAGT